MNFFDRKYFPLILLFSIVLVSRLPFLSAGYGVEEDSWGIALAAFHTKMSGVYEPSRFPGHPVHEFIYSAFWGFDPFFYNLFSAIFSAIGAVFFALILQNLHFRYYFIAALAFAFTPIYYISSTYTIDFVWTITLILISFYCLLKRQYVFVGIFLGLAIGCRITSGAMLLPFVIIFYDKNDFASNVKIVSRILLPLIITVAICYLPLFYQFGLSFFMYYDQFPYPSLAKVFYKMIPGVFGLLGFISLVICLLVIFVTNRKVVKGKLYKEGLSKRMILSCLLVIVLYTISYFRLPQKSGYMITVIPFLIILFGYYLSGAWFKFLSFSLIFSSFVCSINLTDSLRGAAHSEYAFTTKVSGQEIFFDPFAGPIFSDYSKRLRKMNYIDDVIQKTEKITSKTVVISGWWYNEIMVTMIPKKSNPLIVFEPYIDADKIGQYISGGYLIKYLPEQNIYNDQMFKMHYTDSVAKVF